MRAWLLLLMVALAGCSGSPPGDDDPDDPDDPRLKVVLDPVASGLSGPILATHAGDDRLFIVEQRGRILVQAGDGSDRQTFVDIQDLVRDGGERGLLGVAFRDGSVYVHYTDQDGDTVVSRIPLVAGAPVAEAAEVLLRVDQPYSNHNGGHITFGPDGMLYIALGDGGSANDPDENGQDPHTLLGSILRIDVSGQGPYTIPADNPFADGQGGAPEVYVWGLRNPWRFSFDADGGLWIGDVGQGSREEISHLPAGAQAGANLGWPAYEGTKRHRGPDAPGAVAPVTEYRHGGGICAVTGGHVYRGSIASLQGLYVFGDYCSGQVWTFDGSDTTELLESEARISSFGEDAAGELYLIDHGGRVYRFVEG